MYIYFIFSRYNKLFLLHENMLIWCLLSLTLSLRVAHYVVFEYLSKLHNTEETFNNCVKILKKCSLIIVSGNAIHEHMPGIKICRLERVNEILHVMALRIQSLQFDLLQRKSLYKYLLLYNYDDIPHDNSSRFSQTNASDFVSLLS